MLKMVHCKNTPDQIHFLHIGKTGGTALKYALANMELNVSWLHIHTHATTFSDIPQGERIFFFLRNPISRFVSAFYSRQRKGYPKYNVPWTELETVAFSAFKTPNQLAMALSSPIPAERDLAILAMNNIGHVRNFYSRWLGSAEALEKRAQDIFFVGLQEYLDEDCAALAKLLDVGSLNLPVNDIDAHRNPSNVDRTLESMAISNLEKWYEGDFQTLEICRNIAQKAGFGGSLGTPN